jgi:hypothetical protein
MCLGQDSETRQSGVLPKIQLIPNPIGKTYHPALTPSPSPEGAIRARRVSRRFSESRQRGARAGGEGGVRAARDFDRNRRQKAFVAHSRTCKAAKLQLAIAASALS